MTGSIWVRANVREQKSAGMNPYRGARYYADAFSVIPSAVKRDRRDIAALDEEEFGPPVNPRKGRDPALLP